MYLKVINHFGGDIVSSSTSSRHLQAIVDKDVKADPFGWNFYSKKNFKFYSYINGDLNTTAYNTPLNAQSNGVDAIYI